ncbi:hypothetical protein [Fibrisoma limi]|uniref:hypothetical protein n=1 Tax=Fibrisoma limi TaxID=663275 RepID=UPI0005873929|nr:hypothetical protein [Fibrisoma limi]
MNLVELVTELKRLNFEIEVLKNIFSEIDADNDESKIKVGSRVLIKWGHGGETKGRVVGIRKSDGAFYVHRDGYVGTIGLGINKPGLSEHTLENLSVGAYRKLDQRLWHSQIRVSEIQDSIKEIVGMNDDQFDQFCRNLK